jgi:hypothetical protein
MYHE